MKAVRKQETQDGGPTLNEIVEDSMQGGILEQLPPNCLGIATVTSLLLS